MSEILSTRARILIIDDEPNIRDILAELLAEQYECLVTSSAEQGLEVLRATQVSLVITDINMAGISGLEMVPKILELAPDTAVIMMSGTQTIETAIDALRVGAFDYLTKPFDLRHVEAAVKRALDHHELLLGKRRYESELEEKVKQRTADLLKTTEELREQIAERAKVEERLNYLAYYDLLTELPNRVLFKDRLAQALNLARRDDQIIGVILLSVDRLKSISETLGAAIADQLVCQVAERLKGSMRDGDTLGYWGSDEFAILFTQLTSMQDAVKFAQRVQEILEPRFQVETNEFYVTASMGIVLFPSNGKDEDTLLKRAGAALFQAKQRGANHYEFYTAGMNAKALKRLSMESGLRRAIEQDEFLVYYQPRVSTATWQIVGAEALVRWNHPEKGIVSPVEFIPLAEDAGLISAIDEWVLRAACHQTKKWQQTNGFELRMASNVSARHFQEARFFDSVLSVLDQTGLEPEFLELELTESSIMNNPESAIRTLANLNKAGIKVAVDDFGTGFSSLGYLKRLSIDTLKIDRSFVNDLTVDPDDAALVMAIITLAHNLRLEVVAEGVETAEQLKLLHLLRCDEVQGYLFSKPLPAEEFANLLIQGRFTKQLETTSPVAA
jgi:diguanylate cyclase (GGDEF)-like protein